MRVRREVLAIVYVGVALGGAHSAAGQDATSANLPEHFQPGEAMATPKPKKKKPKPPREFSETTSSENPAAVPERTPPPEQPPTSVASAKETEPESTPETTAVTSASSQKPSPVPEPMPSAEEPATSIAPPEKKARVKRRTTSAVQTEPASFSAPTALSLSAAQAMAVSAPLPEYPYQARHANITGSGLCVMLVDTASGKVTNAMMAQSTGNAILDKVTTETFRRWRFKPGTVSQVRVPITYE